MVDHRALQKRLSALYAEYAQQLPQQLDEVGAALRCLAGATASDEARKALTDVHRRSHSLAGTAGSYGQPEVSAVLRELEELAAAQLGATDRPVESWCAGWIERIEQLKSSTAVARG
jgi:HPt (histidine-containing phosphotransfer) domain-containing protein